MKSPEGFEKDAIKKYLQANGYWFFSPLMAGYGASGMPDLCACKNGAFVAIEVKRPGKEPTPIQVRRINAIRAAGGIAIWGTAEKVIGELKVLFP